ncbi:MAG: fused MFS/spermidine synthase, partial [Chloroflexota bacterium]
DGRYVLNELDGEYDLIAVDAYRPPYIPWHLTTSEFFTELQGQLDDSGVVAINVGRTPTDRRLVEAMTATMLDVFPTVHTIDVPETFNTILVATTVPTPYENIANNLQNLPVEASPILRTALQLAVDGETETVASETVFTDDLAPVELMVDSIVLNFLLSDGVEQLR